MTVLSEVPAVDSGEAASRVLTSVGKALLLLDAFDGAASLLGVSEVARRADLPKSTAYRLLASLEECGYIERRGVRYCLGKRLFELGNQVGWCRPGSLRDVALPHLCDLHRVTRKTVHLAVLDGTDVLYVEKLESREQPGAPTRVGGRITARTTALGKAMLAFSSPETVALALAVPPVPGTRYSIESPHLFREALDEVRRVGFALDREEVRLGLTCVAAPIVRNGQVIGAISVSSSAHDFNPELVGRRVRETAAAVAARVA